MLKKFLFFLLLVAGLTNLTEVKAQDYHLSQFDAAQLYVNPALTGLNFEPTADYRLTGNYRSQWKSIAGKAFSTAFLSFDMPVKRFGLGGYIINNRSGYGNFNSFNLLGSASYKIIYNPESHHNLSVGIQAGLIQKGFSPDMLTFDNQYSYDLGGFEQSFSNGENFSKTNSFNFDANMGIHYSHNNESDKINPFGNFAIYHVTKPDESFTSYKVRTPMRFVFMSGAKINVNHKVKVNPYFLYMYQAKATEITPALQVFYQLKDSISDQVTGGLAYRNKDAFSIHAGFKKGLNTYRISYDVNTSPLNRFSGRGAFELGVVYYLRKKNVQ